MRFRASSANRRWEPIINRDSRDDQAAARTQIATEILKVHEDSYGVGADGVSVHFAENLVVVWINEIAFTLAEQALLDGGHATTVLATRSAFQDAIEPTFCAIVERATGRRVADFLSTTSLRSASSVELFRLHPALA